MKKHLSLLVGLLLSLTSVAQTITPIAWIGNHITPFEQTVLLDSTWSGVASVKAYTAPNGRLISALLQPTMTRQGNSLFIRFGNTANMSNSTYVTISTGTIVRRAGYLSLGTTSTVKVPEGTDTGGVGTGGIINTDMVQGLPLLLAKKVDTQTQSARDQGQDNQLAGFSSALSQIGNSIGDPVAFKAVKDTAKLAITRANNAIAGLNQRVVHVADINALNNTAGNASTSVVVRDKVRGGTFAYSASGTVDNGITFSALNGGVWNRIFDNKIQGGWYALNGNGTTADQVNIQKAIDAQAARGGGSVELPNGTFLISGTILPKSKVELTGQGDGTILLMNSNAGVINAQGTVSSTSYSMAVQPLRSHLFIRTTVASPFAPGDWIRVRSEDIWLSNSDGNKQAFIVRVARVSGDSTILMNPLPENYALASAKAEKINPITNFTLSNLKLKNIPNTRLASLTIWNFCSELRIVNVSAEGSDEAGFDLQNVWESEIDRIRCTDFVDDPNNGRYGYGIGFSGACYNVLVTNSTFRNTRHATTTLGSSLVYGVPRNITFSNCHSSESSLTHFDSHQLGEEISYIGCTATGGKSKVSFGFQIRNRQANLVGCTAYNTTGAGFYIINGSINKYTTIIGCVASQIRYGSGFIISNGANVKIVGGRATECDYQGVLISGVNSPSSVHIQGMGIEDNNRVQGENDAIFIDDSNGGVTVDNCTIGRVASFTLWNHRYGVNLNNSSNVTISNNKFKINSTASYSLSGPGNRAYRNKFDDTADVNYLKEMEIVPGSGAPTITPGFIGQRFVDSTNKKVYEATGTGSPSDWTLLN